MHGYTRTVCANDNFCAANVRAVAHFYRLADTDAGTNADLDVNTYRDTIDSDADSDPDFGGNAGIDCDAGLNVNTGSTDSGTDGGVLRAL